MNLRKRKITDPRLYELGWMAGRISLLPPVAGEVFLLTSPFIERAYRKGSFQYELFRYPRRAEAKRYVLMRTKLITKYQKKFRQTNRPQNVTSSALGIAF